MADAPSDEDRGCWQKKATYDQCFDQWYKDVFLQQKANGQVGCQAEYKAYSECFLKELGKDTGLVEGIKSVMAPDVRQRWEAQTNSSNASDKKPADDAKK